MLPNLEESLVSGGRACTIKARRKTAKELKCRGCVPRCSKEPFLGVMLFL